MFTCETNGYSIGWRVQGTNLLPDSYHDITTSLLSVTKHSKMEEMVFLTRAEYNESRIQCLTENNIYIDFNSCLVESETAILNIQGKKQFLAYSFATRIVKGNSVKQLLLQVHFRQFLI